MKTKIKKYMEISELIESLLCDELFKESIVVTKTSVTAEFINPNTMLDKDFMVNLYDKYSNDYYITLSPTPKIVFERECDEIEEEDEQVEIVE
jgi:hypothetical protein